MPVSPSQVFTKLCTNSRGIGAGLLSMSGTQAGNAIVPG